MGTTRLATAPADITSRTDAPTDARAVDTDGAVATLVVAFAEDPVVRWFFPDSTGYLTAFPEVVRLTCDGTSPVGTIDVLDGGTGAAIWHVPGTATPDEAFAALVATRVPTSRHAAVYGFLEQMSRHHPDSATVWYLPFVGVDPRQQGQGHGSTLLQRGLARADRDGLPAYLEASSPRNRALYERHGFEVVGEVRVADSPPMWPMLRQPR